MYDKLPVNVLIEGFCNNPNILDKSIKTYKQIYKKEPKKDDILYFILEHLPDKLSEYTPEEQKEIFNRLDFYLFQEFVDEQDHSEDIYDELNLPPLYTKLN